MLTEPTIVRQTTLVFSTSCLWAPLPLIVCERCSGDSELYFAWLWNLPGFALPKPRIRFRATSKL